jgi:hypothetical protein
MMATCSISFILLAVAAIPADQPAAVCDDFRPLAILADLKPEKQPIIGVKDDEQLGYSEVESLLLKFSIGLAVLVVAVLVVFLVAGRLGQRYQKPTVGPDNSEAPAE